MFLAAYSSGGKSIPGEWTIRRFLPAEKLSPLLAIRNNTGLRLCVSGVFTLSVGSC